MIPEGKGQQREKTITYNQLLLAKNYDSLIEELIEKEVRNNMYKSMPVLLDYLNKKLKLTWDNQLNGEIITASLIRNCCMHNNCIADKNLAKDKRFTEGKEIILNSGEVHSFGIQARQFSRELWESAQSKYNL